MSILDKLLDPSSSDGAQIVLALNRIALALERLSPALAADESDDEATVDETPYVPEPQITEEEIPNGQRAAILSGLIIESGNEGY